MMHTHAHQFQPHSNWRPLTYGQMELASLSLFGLLFYEIPDIFNVEKFGYDKIWN